MVTKFAALGIPVVTDAVAAAAAWGDVPLSLVVEALAVTTGDVDPLLAVVEAVAADVDADGDVEVEVEMRLADFAVGLISAVLVVLPAVSTGEAELAEGFPIPPQAARTSTGIAAIVRYRKALRIRL
jgi:hypothetical protein